VAAAVVYFTVGLLHVQERTIELSRISCFIKEFTDNSLQFEECTVEYLSHLYDVADSTWWLGAAVITITITIMCFAANRV
jgi:hypothetical protein